MFSKVKKGQSTVEYIVLVTAVLAVAILFMVSGGGNSPFQSKLNSTLSTVTDQMTNMANRLTGQ
ncbi:MAG: class III signal peptide-containing protein [Candidatus Omnitrophica bacterium]|nr:class III signal peptide-containing protein [Candidatus Omnitrophota bacterium]